MKRSLYSTTAIISPQVCYDPITAAIATAVGVAEGTLAFALIGIGVNLAVSAVATWLLGPDLSGQERGLLANGRDAAAPREYVYGEVRKGGVITYLEATGDDNRYLHMIVVLAGHEVDEISDIYINDEIVTITDDVVLGPNYVTGDTWKSKIRIKKYTGNQTATDPDLLAESNQIDANFVGHGLAYLYIRLTYDAEVFANGIPLFTAKVRGKKVFDPVNQVTNYSANFARCVRDYLVADYGLDDTAAAIDDISFASATTVCDEDVPLSAGGSQKRYELHGVLSAAQTPANILQNMMTAGAGTLFWGQGKWQLRPGYYSAPAKTLNADDLRSGISIETRTARRDNFNAVQGTFKDAEQDYIEAEYPKISGAGFLAEDGGIASTYDLPLPYTTNATAAQRLAKLTLHRSREQIAFNAEFSLAAFDVEPGDIIALDFDRYGWSGKEFEVTGWRFALQANAGDLRVTLALRETSSAAFDWNAEESEIIANNTSLLGYRETAGVSIGSPSVQLLKYPDGSELPVMTVGWIVTREPLASEYVFQWRKNAIDYAANGGMVVLSSPTSREQEIYDAYLSILFRAPDQAGFDAYVNGPLTIGQIEADLGASSEAQNQIEFNSIVTKTKQAELRVLDFDQIYDLRVVSRNGLGVTSAPSTTTILVERDTTAPPVPTHTGKSNTVIGNQATLRWNNPATDGSGSPVYDLHSTEIWRAETNTLTLDGSGDPSNATRLGFSKTEEFTDTSGLANTTYYYFLRAIDFAGNASAFDAGRQVDLQSPGTGQSGVGPVLSPESANVPSDPDGSNPVLTGITATMSVFVGTADDSANWGFAITATNNATATIAGQTITVTGFTDDTGHIDITATKSGFTPITKRFSLSKAKAGTSGIDGIDGANGTDGTDGADGVSAVEVVIAGAARTVPANAAGVVSNYAESGCEINVYENTDTLGFITSTSSAALTPGTWQIYSTTVSPSGDITVGPISDGGNEAIIGNHSGMDNGTDTVTITYRVRAKRDNGSIVTRSIRQTISKARAGQDGAAGNPGTDGASVLVIYGSTANEASNAQNLDPAGKNYVAYYEYTGATPSLPIRTGISFVKYIGEDGAPSQGVWPIYADNAGGSGQSFSDVGKTHVTFYEATSQPSLPVSGQTFVKHIGDDGTDGTDGTNGQDGADGARGPGEYFIAVGSMSAANSSAEAHSLFTSAVGAPVADDTATFYTGTAANPTDQITWRYTGASWTEIVKRYKGSVVIDGTLYVQALVLDGSKFEGGPGDELTTKEKAFGEMQIKQDLTGASIFADGSWQNIESFTLQNDAEGDMFIELTCVVYATGTDGSDVTTNYLDYQLRLVVDPPGAGSVIAVRSQRRLLPNGDAEVTISLPQADLSSRTAGTIDVDLEAKINGRNPAGFNLGVRDITLKAMELKT